MHRRRPLLPDAVEKVRGRDPEAARQADDGREPRLADAALEERDLGPVEPALEREALLREPGRFPVLAQVSCETLDAVHANRSTDGAAARFAAM
jgi:hypothetical protein